MSINKEIQTIFNQAISDHQNGQLNEAERGYREILNIESEHPDANHNLGVIAIQLNQTEAGLPYFQLALKKNPAQSQYWISYIDALIRLDKLQAARNLLQEGLLHGLRGNVVDKLVEKLDVNSQSTHQFKTDAVAPREEGAAPNNQAFKGSRIQGLESIKNINSLRQPSKDYLNRVNPLIKKKKYIEAATLAKKETDKFPNFGQGFKMLAFLYTQLGSYADAETALINAIRLLPNDWELQYNLALAYQRNGNYPDAEKAYRISIELKPNFPEAHNNLGCMLAELERYTESELSLQKAINFKPRYPEAFNNLGNLLNSVKRPAEAEECLIKAITLSPNYAEAYNNLGNALRAQKKIGQAEQHYRRALMLNNKYAEAYNNLANIFKENYGLLEDAIEYYILANTYNPEYSTYLLNLGNTLLSYDKLEDAFSAYKKAASLMPKSKALEAAVNIATIYFLNGDNQKAREWLDFSIGITAIKDSELTNSKIYWRLIDQLLNWHQKYNNTHENKTSVLHVIGESHSLSANQLRIKIQEKEFLCKSELIMGCKQWHLGNSLKNEYKFKFEAILERIPKNSLILLCIGEIDCRHNEGIISFWRKAPSQEITEIIQITIISYIEYITKLAKKYGHSVILSGVPAANIEMNNIAEAESDLLVKVIENFNLALKKNALKYGLNFLDVYSLTKLKNRSSNPKYYLDEHHLKPEAIIEAFQRNLVWNSMELQMVL